jgi:hypothetical protein
MNTRITTGAQNTVHVLNQLLFGMLIVDMSAVKLPGKAKQDNLPLECGQPIDAGGVSLPSKCLVKLAASARCFQLPSVLSPFPLTIKPRWFHAILLY